MRKLVALIVVLCIVSCTAIAETNESVKTTKVGNITFQIPSNLNIESTETISGISLGYYSCPEYEVSIYGIDYSHMSFTADEAISDEQLGNAYYQLTIAFDFEEEMRLRIANDFTRVDANLLNGQDLVYLCMEGLAFCCHYYRNTGFMVVVCDQTEVLSDKECYEIALDIARSFRIDGVSEADMIADAEALAAQPGVTDGSTDWSAALQTVETAYFSLSIPIDWQYSIENDSPSSFTPSSLKAGNNDFSFTCSAYRLPDDLKTKDGYLDNPALYAHLWLMYMILDEMPEMYMQAITNNRSFYYHPMSDSAKIYGDFYNPETGILYSFYINSSTADAAETVELLTEIIMPTLVELTPSNYVIITNSSANIRSGPDGSAAKIATAVKGDTFPLLGEEGNWYMIDVNGQTGYVTKSLSAIQ